MRHRAHLHSFFKIAFLAVASASEGIMAMQSDNKGRGGLADNLTLQLGLLAAVVIVVIYAAAHYIW
jgi:hypothetical protein